LILHLEHSFYSVKRCMFNNNVILDFIIIVEMSYTRILYWIINAMDRKIWIVTRILLIICNLSLLLIFSIIILFPKLNMWYVNIKLFLIFGVQRTLDKFELIIFKFTDIGTWTVYLIYDSIWIYNYFIIWMLNII